MFERFSGPARRMADDPSAGQSGPGDEILVLLDAIEQRLTVIEQHLGIDPGEEGDDDLEAR